MEVTLFAEKIAQIGNLPITNTLLTSWITMSLIILFAYVVSKRISPIPGKIQGVAEILVEGIYQTIADLSDNERAKKFFPFVATFFIFILISNYLGLLPGIGTIGFHEIHHGEEVFVPLFRSASSDLNFTLALALISVFLTHYFSIKALGLGSYLGRFFSINPVFLFVGLLEIIAEITKVFSLSFRLFGNIFAGEVLLVTISSLLAFLAPLPFMFLELIVGFVQATIFMMLTAVFMIVLTQKEAH
jgi:F-type H+-transporting ATPase subunit a